MKYIDVDKLIAEIEKRRDSALERQKNLEKIGQETVLNEMIAFELNKILSFITSLHQEQPEVDLEDYISNKLRKLGADLINHKPYSFNRGLNVGETNAYHDILDRLNARKEE